MLELGPGGSAATLGLSVGPRQPALTHSYLDARGSEVGDLELDADGGLALLVFGFHTGEAKVGPHQVLLATLGTNEGGLGSCPAHSQWAISQASPSLPAAEAGQAVKGLHQLLRRDGVAAEPGRPAWPWWEREPGSTWGGGVSHCTGPPAWSQNSVR